MAADNDIAVTDSPPRKARRDSGTASLEGLYSRPGFKIRRAHQTAVSVFAEATSELNITTSQYGVLHTLAHIEGLDQITLARLVGLDRSTTSLVLGLLEQRGTVERTLHQTDRRRRVLIITPAGRELYEKAQRPVAQAIRALMEPLAAADRDPFLDLLERVVAAATQPVEPAMAASLRELYRRPGFLIRRAHQISTALFIEEGRPFDITPTQFGMMFVLRQRPNLDQVTLAQLARFDRSTNAMVVDLLETRGLIERRVDVADRRRRLLNLTPAGQAMLDDVTPGSQRARERLLAPLTAAERQFLADRLDAIVSRFEAEEG